jgi:hypothetical protein
VSRGVALGVVVLAAIVAVVSAVLLWRSRRSRGEGEPWQRQDSLAVLGILVAVVGVVVPLLVSDGGASEEDPEVRAYRQDVASACRTLKPSTNPLMDAMTPAGSFDRTLLVNGLRQQLTAARGVLDSLWKREVPDELADDAGTAKKASRSYLRAMSDALDRIEQEQPATLTFQQLSALSGVLDAETRPAASEMESALTRLAGEPCLAPAPSTSP